MAQARYLALRKLGRETGRSTAEMLQLFALEGFLSRLAHSVHRDRFVLKGGMLLAAFDLRRPTRDVDLLALRTDNDEQVVRALVQEVAAIELDDGLEFHSQKISSSLIRDNDQYPGVRVRLEATLATARLVIQADVNVGDPVHPAPVVTAVPTLLGEGSVMVLGYPKSMVIAEKIVTALQRGRANTRWRDFADLYLLLGTDQTESETVVAALREVARHRQVSLAPLASVLGGMGEQAQGRWQVWWRQQSLAGRVPESFAEVLAELDVRTNGWLREPT